MSISQCLIRREWSGKTHVVEQLRVLATVSQAVIHDRARARRLARNRDTARIAAKLGNMLLHPFQRKPLIQQAGVQRAIGLDLGRREIPEGAEPVLDLDRDEPVVIRIQPDRRVIRRTEHIPPAAVDPDEHGQVRRVAPGVHVQVQAVLVAEPRVEAVDLGRAKGARLRAERRRLDGGDRLLVSVILRLHWLRSLPAEVAHGRGCIADAVM